MNRLSVDFSGGDYAAQQHRHSISSHNPQQSVHKHRGSLVSIHPATGNNGLTDPHIGVHHYHQFQEQHVTVVDAEGHRSLAHELDTFCPHLAFSCFVFWCCNFLFGMIAIGLACTLHLKVNLHELFLTPNTLITTSALWFASFRIEYFNVVVCCRGQVIYGAGFLSGVPSRERPAF